MTTRTTTFSFFERCGHFWALDGGPHVACRFQEMLMSHVSVPYLCPCHISNLRNGPVACRIQEMVLSHVNKLNVACRIQEMALSILGV